MMLDNMQPQQQDSGHERKVEQTQFGVNMYAKYPAVRVSMREAL
jgi:hypothetical protein